MNEIIDAKQITEWGHKNDDRVIADDHHAEFVKESGLEPCEHCEGTGNEFFFMYRACSKCNGTGVQK